MPHGASAPSPRKRGEGRGEGAFPQAQTRGDAPSPGMCAKKAVIPTSPRKRGEVKIVPREFACLARESERSSPHLISSGAQPLSTGSRSDYWMPRFRGA